MLARLTAEQRAVLDRLGDALIPASDGMPAWSEVEHSEKWLERALAARADLFERLVSALDAVKDLGPLAAVRHLHSSDQDGFRAVATIVSGAYYINMKVWRRIGYPGQGGRLPFPDEFEHDIRDDLLAPVLASDPAPRVDVPTTPREPTPLAFDFSPREERTDVLVIGAGAGGAVAARYLAAAGFRVVCLEQGDWADTSAFPGGRQEWELLIATTWNADPNVRRSPADYPIERSRSPISPVMYNGVGGSTIHFGAQWLRMRPQDFALRSLHGIADDWPISYRELRPFYERLDAELHISGLGGDPRYPAGPPPPLPPLPLGQVGRRAAQGMNRLKWHWWPGDHAIRSLSVGALAGCERTGTCMWGCPQGAKASVDTNLWPAALRDGARLVTGARVREIIVDGRGLATGAVYVDREGHERRQQADVVILACNGVGSPRVLLLSTSTRFPDGLANSSGLVGKRLMLHPYVSVLGVYDDDLESWLGPRGSPIYSLEFADHDEARGFPGGALMDVLGLGGPLSTLERFDDLPLESRWGPAVHGLVERSLGHAFDWGVGIEDLPHEHNRVTLDGTLVDSDGIPVPSVAFELDDEMRANLRHGLDRAREAHEAAGAVETIDTDWSGWGWHVLGTARMGDDPETSVVDRWCQAHDVPNLYLVDGSVFVTSGAMAPTATLCANAMRVVDNLTARARLQQVPT